MVSMQIDKAPRLSRSVYSALGHPILVAIIFTKPNESRQALQVLLRQIVYHVPSAIFCDRYRD